MESFLKERKSKEKAVLSSGEFNLKGMISYPEQIMEIF